MRTPTLRFIVPSMLLILGACSDDGSSDDTTTDSTTDSTTDAGTDETAGTSETTGETTAEDDVGTTTEGGGENYCAHQCTSDADCTIGGVDSGLTCVDSFCTGESSGCSTDDECIATLSGWSFGTACTAGGGECDALGQICIEVEGEGHCVTGPTDVISCETLTMDEIPTTDIDGEDVIVCGQADAACHEDGYCFLPCSSDTDCLSTAYPSCNVDTGTCECASDNDCATLGEPEFGTCNAGVCGCSADDQCVEGDAGDVCNSNGACGCSDDAACANVESSFDGGEISCVSI
ncbi:hypothetical protein G6O69_15765 [Pseudenhygromyxa sp. WMMC2535]|uniref:hypothetical protein n=1 Tax=Pseudenhygromyxa sp. WMMC2535 TaxID=2712867 RepID=UPI0015547534|nr:hypothetical protein [Pseudenhygromyxa sp. WMMC2535]NVB39300.1 hypothetical protein [Pseudenhygromyxa sp. WMMC2535]